MDGVSQQEKRTFFLLYNLRFIIMQNIQDNPIRISKQVCYQKFNFYDREKQNVDRLCKNIKK